MMAPQHCQSTDARDTTTTDGAVLTTARQDHWSSLARGNNVSNGGADSTTSALLLAPCSCATMMTCLGIIGHPSLYRGERWHLGVVVCTLILQQPRL